MTPSNGRIASSTPSAVANPFTPLKTEQETKDVAEKGPQPCGSGERCGVAYRLGDQDGHGPFTRVPDEGQERCPFVSGAQNIGCARIFRAKGAGVG